MANDLPVTSVVPVSQMRGENDEETALLGRLSQEAQEFLSGFRWCKAIQNFYFGDGIGGIFGVFLAHIEPVRRDVDEYLWVVVGDIPPAYLVTDVCRTPKQAMSAYIAEMRRWVDAAKLGKIQRDVIPVNLRPSANNAQMLERRLDTLERDILPSWFADDE